MSAKIKSLETEEVKWLRELLNVRFSSSVRSTLFLKKCCSCLVSSFSEHKLKVGYEVRGQLVGLIRWGRSKKSVI